MTDALTKDRTKALINEAGLPDYYDVAILDAAYGEFTVEVHDKRHDTLAYRKNSFEPSFEQDLRCWLSRR